MQAIGADAHNERNGVRMDGPVTARDAKRWDERLHEHDEAIAGIKELQAEGQKQTALLCQMVDGLQKSQERTDRRVCTLEALPGRRWDTVVDRLIYSGVAAVAAVAGSKLIGG